jgi:threonine dehydratase
LRCTVRCRTHRPCPALPCPILSFHPPSPTRSGQPDTVADGLRTCLGSNTFPIVQHCVDAVVCVSEDAIRGAVRLIWERMKLCIEPSAGVGVAALLSPDIAAVLGDAKRVGVILCVR